MKAADLFSLKDRVAMVPAALGADLQKTLARKGLKLFWQSAGRIVLRT